MGKQCLCILRKNGLDKCFLLESTREEDYYVLWKLIKTCDMNMLYSAAIMSNDLEPGCTLLNDAQIIPRMQLETEHSLNLIKYAAIFDTVYLIDLEREVTEIYVEGVKSKTVLLNIGCQLGRAYGYFTEDIRKLSWRKFKAALRADSPKFARSP